MRLDVTPGRLAICRLPPHTDVPDWAQSGTFVSVTRTRDELSIVTADDAVPTDIRAERGWRALAVRGPLDFALTGVLSSLAQPLADAGVSIVAISTYDTDWILVRDDDLHTTVNALQAAGHTVS